MNSLKLIENNKSYMFIEVPAKERIDFFNDIWNSSSRSIDIKNKFLKKLESIYIDKKPYDLYVFSLSRIFENRLEEFNTERINNEINFKETKIYNSLYEFQKHAVHAIIEKINKFNGCILADSVGLGKTYEALATIKYFELQGKRVLVLCPKKLSNNWNQFNKPVKTNLLLEDGFKYTVLNHSDLTRTKGYSDGIDLKNIDWSNFDLVVIDESHNFRNGSFNKNKENYNSARYEKLMNEIILNGRNTSVLLLSATPVNNKIQDINSQINLITKNNDEAFKKYDIKSIKRVCERAESKSNEWAKLNKNEKTSKKYEQMIGMDFRRLIDLITIARSRKQIESTYKNLSFSFPKRKKPISVRPDIGIHNEVGNIKLLNNELSEVLLACYKPMHFIKSQYIKEYEDEYDWRINNTNKKLRHTNREENLVTLMRINLLKRFESSIDSFRITIKRILDKSKKYYEMLDKENLIENDIDEFDDEEIDSFEFKKIKIKKEHIDKVRYKSDLQSDILKLEKILKQYEVINSDKDGKLNELISIINQKINNPFNSNNKKIIIFTSYIDTAKYIYETISQEFKKQNIYSLLITGNCSKSNHPNLSGKNLEFDEALTYFSPKSKMLDAKNMIQIENLEILIATDCVSEGQNLQDSDFVINYDIHWNPVRLIQRFGRIDRIGSENKYIQMVNFWPNIALEEYINLELRVTSKMMKVTNSSTSDADLLNLSTELQQKYEQLSRLEDETVDLEDIKGDVSFSNITLSEFTTDLKLQLEKNARKLTNQPEGIFTIASCEENRYKKGIIFLFRNKNNNDIYNQINPYFLIFIDENNNIQMNYEQSTEILMLYKSIANSQNCLNKKLINEFNEETKFGKNMDQYVESLNKAIESIKKNNNKNNLDILIDSENYLLKSNEDEFSLVSFLIIK